MDEILKTSKFDRSKLKYTGKKPAPLGYEDKRGKFSPYLPAPALVEAVNLAIQLERPLLLKGDPGSGKTQLAQAVAYELDLPYKSWHVQSTSRARDGRYVYDTIARLRDAQLVASGQLTAAEVSEEIYPHRYIHWKAIGQAFREAEKPMVVLIDEIDKADPDFPNDLLLELDEMRFPVEELDGNEKIGEEYKKVEAKHKPIIFITSNNEKTLSDAFLRRCLFFFIDFPDRDGLIEIFMKHCPTSRRALVEVAIQFFVNLRKEMEKGADKPVSTSEMLDWVRALLDNKTARAILKSEDAMRTLKENVLYPGVLFKTWNDYKRFSGNGRSRDPLDEGR